MSQPSKTKPLRIACLLPSATDICLALGLADSIVGVTHECNVEGVYLVRRSKEPILILTEDGLNVTQQGDIHEAVAQQQEINSCTTEQITLPESLYPTCILETKYVDAAPSVILTQALSSVCAPSTEDVKRIIKGNGDDTGVTIIALKPTCLNEVADTFVTVAKACKVPERGIELRDKFLGDLNRLNLAIENSRDINRPKPKLLLLEWLDPPFDGGHWVPEMIKRAGAQIAMPTLGEKSHPISWGDINETDPDVLVVACCGFDLKRNVRDALRANHRFSSLSSYSQNTIYAADGNTYFACPGPNLVGGTAILARCAYQDQPTVLKAIDKLASSSVSIFDSCSAWHRVDFGTIGDIDDVEDLVKHDFSSLHDKACAAGDLTYTDPETGYSVMTEVAHKKRGSCCGSGCRHCPFRHENVKDKSNRIQQPAFMYEGESEMFSVTKHEMIKVLFFSGGKDSFLALRAQVRKYKERPFGLVLLTTFDAQTRVIAHQNVHIDEVLRQSRHLDISLVGIPMHRESREPYVNRISRGLEMIQSKYGSKVSALIFGDLHLAHIKSWRDKELGALGFELEYPLWQVPYPVLLNDLEKSRVTFKVSATTKNGLSVGTSYTRQVHDEIQNDLTSSRDGFGENGEFHTIAQIWLVERDIVLGL